MQVPSIDQNVCGQWTELDLNMYNRLPYYFEKAKIEFRKYWPTWPKLLGRIPWTPNMGDTMRRVMVEMSPVLRQQAAPTLLRQTPRQDMVAVRERTADAQIHWQQFVSPNFRFLPSFQDFMRGNIKPSRENIDRQVTIFEEQFYRTNIWHWAPFVYLCGVGGISAPTGDPVLGNTAAKTDAWLQNLIGTNDAAIESLTFKEMFKALNFAEDEVGATPFDGSGTPGGDSNPLNERFALVGDSVTWNQLLDDPWLKENRPLNMNIVTEGFKGDLFGKIRYKPERYGFRVAFDNNFAPSWPQPEIIELDPTSADYQRTRPNPSYAGKTVNGVPGATIKIGFLVGGPNYSCIEVGPPPADFAGGGIPEGFGKMNWNGKTIMNKNFLVQCLDSNNNIFWDTNSWGHYLRLQAEVSLGIVGDNRFNIIPIIYKSKVGLTTVNP